jgi:hypothetical protein
MVVRYYMYKTHLKAERVLYVLFILDFYGHALLMLAVLGILKCVCVTVSCVADVSKKLDVSFSLFLFPT